MASLCSETKPRAEAGGGFERRTSILLAWPDVYNYDDDHRRHRHFELGSGIARQCKTEQGETFERAIYENEKLDRRAWPCKRRRGCIQLLLATAKRPADLTIERASTVASWRRCT